MNAINFYTENSHIILISLTIITFVTCLILGYFEQIKGNKLIEIAKNQSTALSAITLSFFYLLLIDEISENPNIIRLFLTIYLVHGLSYQLIMHFHKYKKSKN